MPDALTPTYKFVLPEIGASEDTWGSKLNSDLSALDGLLSDFFIGGSETSLGTGLNITSASPELRLIDDDEADPSGRFRFFGVGNRLKFQRATTAAWAASSDLFILASDKSYVEFPHGIMAAGRGEGAGVGENAHIMFDATGMAGSFDVGIVNVPNASAQAIRLWRNANPAATYSFQMHIPGTTDVHHSFSSDGSAYIRGPLTLGSGGGIVGENQTVAARNDLTKHIDLHGGDVGMSVTSAGSMNINTAMSGFVFFSDGASNVRARVDPVGTTAATATTVMTREKGDARYVRL